MSRYIYRYFCVALILLYVFVYNLVICFWISCIGVEILSSNKYCLKFEFFVLLLHNMPRKKLSFDVVQLRFFNHQLGKSVQELSQMFSVTRKTIYNVVNRAENEERLEPKYGGGCKPKITKRVKCIIFRKLHQNPKISIRMLAEEVKEECGIAVSHEIVRQAILRNKYFSSSARK